jgi:hypothetical protein
VDDAAERGQDLLIAISSTRDDHHRPAFFAACSIHRRTNQEMHMLRTTVSLAAMLLVAASLHTASAQTQPPAAAPAATAAKPSKMKLTVEKLKEMKAKWSANKGKLKACRKEVKSQGLAGDDRWFYIEDCMAKS